MSYILANLTEENTISKLLTVLTEKNLKGMQAKHADNKTPMFMSKCNEADLDPMSETTVIAWHHITHRYLRGLV